MAAYAIENVNLHHRCALFAMNNISLRPEHAIEMVFVTGHAGSSAKIVMLSQKIFFFKTQVSDPVQSPVTKCPHLYLNCRRACYAHIDISATLSGPLPTTL